MRVRSQHIPLIGLITAEALSLAGNQIAAVAMPILVLHYTQSPIAAGIAAAGNILPVLLAALIGGRAIDTVGAWRMSILADTLSFVSVLALPLAFLYTEHLPVFAMFLFVLLGALFDPTGISARQTLVPDIAARSGISLRAVNTWRGSVENGADFLGPIAGVALISTVGIVATFYVNAATFLLCAIIFALSVPRQKTTTTKQPAADSTGILLGIRYIFQHRSLRALALAGLIANAVILSFLSLLLPVLATQTLHSTTLLGICLSVFGLAATLSAASFAWLSVRLSHTAIYYGGLLLTGGSIVLCSIATTPSEAVAAVALSGLLLGAGNPLQQTVLHEETPESIAGQVFTALSALHYAAGPAGLVLAGITTEKLGIEPAMMVAGSVLCTTAVAGWLVLPLQHESPEHKKSAPQ